MRTPKNIRLKRAYRSDETVRIDDGVAALDDVAVAHLLAVLVVGVLVIFHVETELVVGWNGLATSKEQQQKRRKKNVYRCN